MLETEEILDKNNIETVIGTIEKMLRGVTQSLLDSCIADLESVKKVQIQQKKSGENIVEYEVRCLQGNHFKYLMDGFIFT